MLYRVIISNFTSFADDCEFNMFPNPKRETFSGHVYENGPLQVLKSSAVYGANGSGKTNFIQALSVLRNFAVKDVRGEKVTEEFSSWYKANRFRLPVADEEKPIGFLAEFGHGGKAYIYFIEIGAKGVMTEKLILTCQDSKKKHVEIYSREGSVIKFLRKKNTAGLKDVFTRQIKERPFSTLLALEGGMHLLDDDDVKNAYLWFRDYLSVVQVSRRVSGLLNALHDNENLSRFVSDVFTRIGLGVKDVRVRDRDFNDVNVKEMMDIVGQKDLNILDKDPSLSMSLFHRDIVDVPSFSLNTVDGKHIIRDFVFSQLGRDGYVGDMELEVQSKGTVRLLSLMPALYNVIRAEKTIVIDEIENSIHPMLIRRLIQLFGESASKGQLIFSTHETSLLDQQELLRPDEVWLIEKKDGCSNMYSLNDFKIHKTLSLEKGYLDGRFGAIPFIGDLKLLTDGPEGTEVQ